MTGTNAINYYAPQIFKALGLQKNEVKLFATVSVTPSKAYLLR